MDLSPLIISIKTALVATAITFFFGLYAARYIRGKGKWQGILDGLLTLPLVLPPTVVGFFLLVFLGRNSVIGSFLQSLDIHIIFSWAATVIAAKVVVFPLMYRTARGAFEQVDENYIYAARTLGMSEGQIFWKIMLPLSWPGVASGTIPGKTQTMSTAIYSAVQSGDRATAYLWSLLIIVLAFVIMILMNYWTGRQKYLMGKR